MTSSASRPTGRPLTTALGWRLPSWLLDYGPIVFILIEGLAAIRFQSRVSGISRPILLLALAATAAALVVRHRWPLPVLAVILGIAVGVDYGPLVTIPLLLAVFTVAESADRTTVVVAALITAIALSVTAWAHGDSVSAGGIISRFLAVGLAVAVGLWLRARADYVTGLQERAERLEREQELMAQTSVAEERLRIARELHDVVAHNVSLMVVQAQALAATGGGADQQQTALTGMADLGREALSEMHRMLGVLRVQNAGGPERSPTPAA